MKILKGYLLKVKVEDYSQCSQGFPPGGPMVRQAEGMEYSGIWEASYPPGELEVVKPMFVCYWGAYRDVFCVRKGQVHQIFRESSFPLYPKDILVWNIPRRGNYSYFRFSDFVYEDKETMTSNQNQIDFQLGPEGSSNLVSEILRRNWTVSNNSSRMGFRLNNLGDKLPKISFPKNSNPVWPGVIQWTGSELICLGKDCQTLGGYPRVMILEEKAQSILFQTQVNQKVYWGREISSP
jgi:hypothetical protein